MATSPREELRIVTVTEFNKDENGVWSFDRYENDGTVSARGGGFKTLTEAADALFEEVGYDPSVAETDPANAHFSAPVGEGSQYDIREYAHGAPEPYQAAGG